jgi:gliding motility-associated-like protein
MLKTLAIIGFVFSFSLANGQITIAFQGGEPGDTWDYVSSGADATAEAQSFLVPNKIAGTRSLVVGGNTPGGSCIDGGTGNGPSTARFFTFNNLDVSSSSNYARQLTFNWGNRHPVCTGTGWDSGENLVFTPYHDGVAQLSTTIAMGGGDAIFSIQQNAFTYSIPPCVNNFYFHLTVTTNRRDELLFIDNVMITTPSLNIGGTSGVTVTQNICESQLPFQWNGFTFNQAGQQSITLTNSFGCDSVVTFVLNVNPSATPLFAQSGPFCSGSTIPALPTTSTNNISGSWSPAINNTATTTYTFTPNAGQCGNPVTTTIQILPNQTPVFQAVTPYCAGDIIPDLPTTSQNGIIGTWSPSINNQQTTTYTFASNNQCVTPATLTIVVNPNVLPSFQNVGPYCAGSIIPELPTTSLNGIIGTWSPAINNTSTTNYTFTPTSVGSGGQCSQNTSLQIIVNQTYTTNQTVALCQNQIPYLWNGQSLSNTGNYSVTLSSQQGCDSTVNLNLTIAPTAIINQSVQVCQSDLPYQFYNQSITVPGVYQHTTNNGSDCDSTFILTLSITSVASFSIANTPISTCTSPLNLTYTIQGGQNVTQCAWSTTGQTGNNCDGFPVQYNFAGCHDVTLTVTDINGCVQTITQNDIACILPSPVANFIIDPINAEIEDEINLVNLSTGAVNYFWQFGDNSGSSGISNPTVSYQNHGSYAITLVAVNNFGCSDTASQVVNITEPVLFYVPNAFTPDGKMFNEIFLPIMTQGFDPNQYKLTIFNRWGETVFVSQHPKKGWDGTYGERYAPDGTYVWQIEFQNLQGVNEVHRGHVNLMR